MDIHLDGYRVFVVTARERSFSKAAEALFITQPAVSHAIKQLEERLGGALFFRTSRGVKLTVEGEMLYRYLEQAFQLVSEAEQKLTEMHSLQSGVVRVGASDTLCRYYLLPYLESFHLHYPEVKLHVTNRTSQETVKLLKDGKIDFGIINLPYEDSQLTVWQGSKLQEVFIAGSKYAALKDQQVTPKQLAAYPLILLEKGSNMRRLIDAYFQSHKIRLEPEFELGSMDLLIQFAKAGLGIACVTAEFATEELASGGLFALQLAPKPPHRHIGIVTLKDVPLSHAAQTMLNTLLQPISEAPKLP
ncbi:LysR family transcriptional regulator [Paenibacillus eucommiae]|uniref:DNA-binding transcriptional LysR family regulator n=1 Tax=Paenibacillus eucommiae TaxID=1355755 RepID=A0ABS4ITH2_9BACL|nr:LysR family transcriptional regulator [Paenibacillus eucommiae]MBP1990872.1 DNA-binding transcriptional LysR family regulator [Paenibacillus eucommiae]